jgi:hypothetical protein
MLPWVFQDWCLEKLAFLTINLKTLWHYCYLQLHLWLRCFVHWLGYRHLRLVCLISMLSRTLVLYLHCTLLYLHWTISELKIPLFRFFTFIWTLVIAKIFLILGYNILLLKLNFWLVLLGWQTRKHIWWYFGFSLQILSTLTHSILGTCR